jgi:(p)ppGpp synthase/HD superfamily hydrolase
MTLATAISIAVEAHAGQLDKYGAPYLKHVMRVMELGKTEDEKIVGVLHDVVEDTAWTFEQLVDKGLAPHQLEALRCVTKLSEDEDYDHFINRIITNRLACTVKINDLTDNMDIRRIPEISEKDVPRLNKYIRAYNKIAAVISGK